MLNERVERPVGVFGAASAATTSSDKPSVRVKVTGLCRLLEHHETTEQFFNIPRCAY